MKTLWLVRHAEAVPHAVNQQDRDRALSDLGVDQATRLGQFLLAHQARIDLMIVSSATRTQTTARLIQRSAPGVVLSSLVVDALYLASQEAIWQIVTEADDAIDSLMIVGHNPGLEALAGQYLPSLGRLGTGELVKITFDCQSWQDAGTDLVEEVRHI